MTFDYFYKRVLQFFVIVFLAATMNFFFPRLSGQDPVLQKVLTLQTQGATISSAEAEAMIEAYSKKFGLDQPLWRQYQPNRQFCRDGTQCAAPQAKVAERRHLQQIRRTCGPCR